MRGPRLLSMAGKSGFMLVAGPLFCIFSGCVEQEGVQAPVERMVPQGTPQVEEFLRAVIAADFAETGSALKAADEQFEAASKNLIDHVEYLNSKKSTSELIALKSEIEQLPRRFPNIFDGRQRLSNHVTQASITCRNLISTIQGYLMKQ